MKTTPSKLCAICSTPAFSSPCENCRKRAWLTYRALTPAEQSKVDERVRQLAERACDERRSPRSDFWTTVGGGKTTLFALARDVVLAGGKRIPAPRSVSFAMHYDRFHVEVIHADHHKLMAEVAPQRGAP